MSRDRDYVLLGLLALGLGLRLFVILESTYIWDEDRDHIALAQTISFDFGRVNLPIRGDYHPALPAYFIKAGSFLAGQNPLGFRLSSLIAGMLTIVVLFRVTLHHFGRSAARWAAALLAVNEYHIGVSIHAVEKGMYLLFVSLTVYGWAAFIRTGRPRFLYFSAVAIGIAYLCNETALLLVPVFLIFLLLSDYRTLLWRKEVYLALLLLLVVIAPDVVWNIFHSGHTAQATIGDRLTQARHPGFSIQPLVFFERGVIFRIYTLFDRPFTAPGREYPAMNSALGALLFGAVLFTTVRQAGRRTGHLSTLLLVLFWTVFGVFLFLPAGSADRQDIGNAAFYWSDITMIPAVILCAGVLSATSRGWRAAGAVVFSVGVVWAVVKVAGALGQPSMAVGYRPELVWPADGRMVDVEARFMFCMLCDTHPRVELVDIRAERAGHAVSAIGTPDVEAADQGTDDRRFRLRASDVERQYRAIYRVTDRKKRTFLLDDPPAGLPSLTVLEHRPATPWRAKFWVE